MPFPPEYGGGGFPWLVGVAMQEVLTSANMGFSLCPLLTQGAIDMLLHYGSEAQREVYLPKMVTGEWTGTMNLTEPQAGSDVGALTTRAVPADDGSWRITGQKIFITYGEHDLADNIVHLVLARVPDAPPGTKGISCFIVPKFLVDDDGTLGRAQRRRVRVDRAQDGDQRQPDVRDGLRRRRRVPHRRAQPGHAVHVHDDEQRPPVGRARGARRRPSGPTSRPSPTPPSAARAGRRARPAESAIVEHADVRRMLLTMKAHIEAMRGIAYLNAEAHRPRQGVHPDEAVRAAGQERAEILTPITKGWGTDVGVELTSLAVQVHGGMGYIEETGVAQHYRDIRIAPIYEGTNGIQAMDLVGRKLGLRGGAAIARLRRRHRRHRRRGDGGRRRRLAVIGDGAARAASATLREATDVAAAPTRRPTRTTPFAAATPYLRLAGIVDRGVGARRAAPSPPPRLRAGDGDGFSTEFLDQKLVTARFFATQVLPAGRRPAAGRHRRPRRPLRRHVLTPADGPVRSTRASPIVADDAGTSR